MYHMYLSITSILKIKTMKIESQNSDYRDHLSSSVHPIYDVET